MNAAHSGKNIARFFFAGALNDFLALKERKTWNKRAFNDCPSVKDAIESFGVPHTEVGAILAGGGGVDFGCQVECGDRIKVCPIGGEGKGRKVRLRPKWRGPVCFVLDSHLGKLARHLRLLGFSSLYEKNYPDKEILKIIQKDRRILLTRDIGLLKNKIVTFGYWVRNTDPDRQLREVIKRFSLHRRISPFKICLECNGRIVRIKKEKIIKRLPPKVREYFNEFFACQRCRKVYWRGSHYEKLSNIVRKAERFSGASSRAFF